MCEKAGVSGSKCHLLGARNGLSGGMCHIFVRQSVFVRANGIYLSLIHISEPTRPY